MLLGIALTATAYEFRLDRAELDPPACCSSSELKGVWKTNILSYPDNMVSQWLPADMPHGQLMWRSLECNSQIPAAVPASKESFVWMYSDLDRSGSIGFRMDIGRCNLISILLLSSRDNRP
jgi:hypothetical protein